jgi:hypothetical protein
LPPFWALRADLRQSRVVVSTEDLPVALCGDRDLDAVALVGAAG